MRKIKIIKYFHEYDQFVPNEAFEVSEWREVSEEEYKDIYELARESGYDYKGEIIDGTYYMVFEDIESTNKLSFDECISEMKMIIENRAGVLNFEI